MRTLCLFTFLLALAACTAPQKPIDVAAVTDRAVRLASQNQFDKAILVVDSAIAAEPKNVDLLYTKFNFLLNNREYDKGIALLGEMHKFMQDNAEAYSYQGYLSDKIGKRDEAQQYYDKAIEACENRVKVGVDVPKSKANIAFLQMFKKDKLAALAAIAELIQENPKEGVYREWEQRIEGFDLPTFFDGL